METSKIIKYILMTASFFVICFLIFYFFITKSSKSNVNNFEDFKNTYIFGKPPVESLLTGNEKLTSDETATTTPEIKIEKLRKISDSPVSGFFVSDKTIRYTEKATGHIYETNATSTTNTRISNTTIPKTQNAIWLNQNSLVIQYVDDKNIVRNFYAEIKADNKGDLEGVFLENNINEIVPFNSKEMIYTKINDTNGISITKSDFNGEKKNKLLDLPLKEWVIQKQNNNLILTTKASSGVYGHSYQLDIKKGELNDILNRIKGLTTLANKDSLILFSRSINNSLVVGIFDTKTKKENALPIFTLPEKCIFSEKNSAIIYCATPIKTNGNYPDEWYQGKISFSDEIWKINLETGMLELVYSPKDIDVIKPDLSENEEYLLFVNKKDSTLWSLKLN